MSTVESFTTICMKGIWIMVPTVGTIEKMDFDEKIELFQQIEIAQGLRKGNKADDVLSSASRHILRKYEYLSSNREKAIYAERVKNQLYDSLKKAMSDD